MLTRCGTKAIPCPTPPMRFETRRTVHFGCFAQQQIMQGLSKAQCGQTMGTGVFHRLHNMGVPYTQTQHNTTEHFRPDQPPMVPNSFWEKSFSTNVAIFECYAVAGCETAVPCLEARALQTTLCEAGCKLIRCSLPLWALLSIAQIARICTPTAPQLAVSVP